jgi:hypothetical protein
MKNRIVAIAIIMAGINFGMAGAEGDTNPALALAQARKEALAFGDASTKHIERKELLNKALLSYTNALSDAIKSSNKCQVVLVQSEIAWFLDYYSTVDPTAVPKTAIEPTIYDAYTNCPQNTAIAYRYAEIRVREAIRAGRTNNLILKANGLQEARLVLNTALARDPANAYLLLGLAQLELQCMDTALGQQYLRKYLQYTSTTQKLEQYLEYAAFDDFRLKDYRRAYAEWIARVDNENKH